MQVNDSVVLTGATGFLGTQFAQYLDGLGFEKVFAFVRPSERSRRLASMLPRLNLIECDFSKMDHVCRELERVKCDYLFHFAAAGAYFGDSNSSEIFNANYLLTAQMMDAVTRLKIKNFVNLGSGSEYGFQIGPISETCLPSPQNEYALTKFLATSYVRGKSVQHGQPATTVRPFAVYGEFEDPRRLISSVIYSLLNGETIKCASPKSVRDFIYAKDLNTLLVKAASRPTIGEIVNAGSAKEYSVKEVVEIIFDVTGMRSDVDWGVVPLKQIEPSSWLADIKKAYELYGWRPQFSLEEGIRMTYQWISRIKER